ncbi:MAG TPA: tetratricopeptide repeat protein [Abditibacteriaceae bacterium]|jgi:tetratricopeptide (TPR) repeat protein
MKEQYHSEAMPDFLPEEVAAAETHHERHLASDGHHDIGTNGGSANGASANGASLPGSDFSGDLTPESGGYGYGGDTDVREALGGYKDAVRQNPHSVRHLTDLAEGYAAADLPHKALQQYQRALQAQREQGGEEMPDAHLGIGDLCRTFAMSATAVRSYERAVRLRPKRPYYRWKLAIALAAMGLYEQSVKQLLTAVELAPRDTYYRFQLADVYLLMHRDDDAIAELKTVVELAPRDDYYLLRLGAALLRAERAAEAVQQFERAVTLQPQNSSYRTLLRYAYTRNHQEPAIAVDVDMLELGAYDEDFVRRIQRLSQPV